MILINVISNILNKLSRHLKYSLTDFNFLKLNFQRAGFLFKVVLLLGLKSVNESLANWIINFSTMSSNTQQMVCDVIIYFSGS